uniref:Uncharacterized protein n=1 Tax=Rhizophora mucronata TaxID=61149 RepID=A0A2P2N6I3_RHIMU
MQKQNRNRSAAFNPIIRHLQVPFVQNESIIHWITIRYHIHHNNFSLTI